VQTAIEVLQTAIADIPSFKAQGEAYITQLQGEEK
jgi:hypothetical protein